MITVHETQQIEFINTVNKLCKNKRITVEYENEVFYMYASVYNSQYFKTITLYINESGFIEINNNEFNHAIYKCPFDVLFTTIDYITLHYASEYKNGLLLKY